jgi:hypothetical protein
MFEGKDHVSEKNILLHMELIERRAIQIISKYAETLSQNRKGQRRPSVLMVRRILYTTFSSQL